MTYMMRKMAPPLNFFCTTGVGVGAGAGASVDADVGVNVDVVGGHNCGTCN